MTGDGWQTPLPLAEGEVLLAAVEVILFLDPDPDVGERYRLRYDGTPSSILGLLSLAQHDVVGHRNEQHP